MLTKLKLLWKHRGTFVCAKCHCRFHFVYRASYPRDVCSFCHTFGAGTGEQYGEKDAE